MKKIFSFLLPAVALLSLVPMIAADGDEPAIQDGPDYYLNNENPDEASIGYMKRISEPDTDGIYTITLESFATGQSVKIRKSLPADVVLILDVSGSMRYNMGSNSGSNNQRLNAMKAAVNAFIDEIDLNDRVDPETGEDREKRLGNQIAIIAFSGPNDDDTTPTANNSIKLNTGWRTLGNDQSISDFTGRNYLKNTAVAGLTANGATMPHFAMQAAESLLSGLGDDRTVRTVVFFTDGDPGWYTNDWEETRTGWFSDVDGHTVLNDNGIMTWTAANETVKSANNIKSKDGINGISSKVYSVSIITDPSACTNVFLDQVSSNYSGVERMAELVYAEDSYYGYVLDSGYYIADWDYDSDNWSPRGGTKGDTKYSMATTNTDELKKIFKDIAEDSGGGSEDLGDQSITEVDVVSASFTLPGDLSSMDASELEQWIKQNVLVYTAECTGRETKQYYDDDKVLQTGTFLTFATPIQAPGNTAKYDKKVIEDGVEKIVKTDVDDAIRVSVSASDLNKPDKLDKIEVKFFDYAGNWCGPRYGEDGKTIIGWHGYKVIIEIPIMMDENAVGGADVDTNGPGSGIYIDGTNVAPFKSPEVSLPINIHIRKEGLQKGESAKFLIERKLKTESIWTEVSSVFVTRTSNDEESGVNAPIAKVVGLPSVDADNNEFEYRIVEGNWSWSYNLVSIKGADGRTIGNLTTRSATTDELESNPFIFVNELKNGVDYKVRHAESKATNTFKTGVTNAEYEDSKENNR